MIDSNNNTGHNNAGDNNTGHNNAGSRNTGSRNTGNSNTGHNNTGSRHTGSRNTGHNNAGDNNTGNNNAGDNNTGNNNAGNRNAGSRNTGNSNACHNNTGSRNAGHNNAGDNNTGHRNTGNRNAGNWNAGNWNVGNWNVGCFNTTTPEVANYFNMSCNKSDWDEVAKPMWLFAPKPTTWTVPDDMSAAEKVNNPTFATDGGFLRTNNMAEEWRTAYLGASDEDVQMVRDLPNFDAEVFEEITGLDLSITSQVMGSSPSVPTNKKKEHRMKVELLLKYKDIKRIMGEYMQECVNGMEGEAVRRDIEINLHVDKNGEIVMTAEYEREN